MAETRGERKALVAEAMERLGNCLSSKDLARTLDAAAAWIELGEVVTELHSTLHTWPEEALVLGSGHVAALWLVAYKLSREETEDVASLALLEGLKLLQARKRTSSVVALRTTVEHARYQLWRSRLRGPSKWGQLWHPDVEKVTVDVIESEGK